MARCLVHRFARAVPLDRSNSAKIAPNEVQKSLSLVDQFRQKASKSPEKHSKFAGLVPLEEKSGGILHVPPGSRSRIFLDMLDEVSTELLI